jgi:hypothetical protein
VHFLFVAHLTMAPGELGLRKRKIRSNPCSPQMTKRSSSRTACNIKVVRSRGRNLPTKHSTAGGARAEISQCCLPKPRGNSALVPGSSPAIAVTTNLACNCCEPVRYAIEEMAGRNLLLFREPSRSDRGHVLVHRLR